MKKSSTTCLRKILLSNQFLLLIKLSAGVLIKLILTINLARVEILKKLPSVLCNTESIHVK